MVGGNDDTSDALGEGNDEAVGKRGLLDIGFEVRHCLPEGGVEIGARGKSVSPKLLQLSGNLRLFASANEVVVDLAQIYGMHEAGLGDICQQNFRFVRSPFVLHQGDQGARIEDEAHEPPASQRASRSRSISTWRRLSRKNSSTPPSSR